MTLQVWLNVYPIYLKSEKKSLWSLIPNRQPTEITGAVLALSSSCTFISLNCEKKYIHQLNNQLFYTFLFNLNLGLWLTYFHLSFTVCFSDVALGWQNQCVWYGCIRCMSMLIFCVFYLEYRIPFLWNYRGTKFRLLARACLMSCALDSLLYDSEPSAGKANQ